MTPAEEAHDRTRRLAEAMGLPSDLSPLAGVRVLVEIGANVIDDENARHCFLAVANLASRLGPYCPQLFVRAPPCAAIASQLYPEAQDLQTQAVTLARNAIPPGPEVRSAAVPGPYDLGIFIGSGNTSATERCHVGWQKDVAAVEGWTTAQTDAPANGGVLAALVAAAMATARLHARLAKILKPDLNADHEGTWRLSPYTLSHQSWTADKAPAFPRTLFVGAGAIADNLAYASHIAGWTMDGVMLDDDVLKGGNANRHPTVPWEKARPATLAKANHLAPLLGVQGIKAKYGQSISPDHPASAFELCVSTVDDADVRREVAYDLPKVLMDASTGGQAVRVLRGSDPAAACVGCAYPQLTVDPDTIWATRLAVPVDTIRALKLGTQSFDDALVQHIRQHGAIKLPPDGYDRLRKEGWPYLEELSCGTATLDPDIPGGSVSYVSAMAGFLAAAQLHREAVGEPMLAREQSWMWGNMFHSPETANLDFIATRSACRARHAVLSAVYQRRWATKTAGDHT